MNNFLAQNQFNIEIKIPKIFWVLVSLSSLIIIAIVIIEFTLKTPIIWLAPILHSIVEISGAIIMVFTGIVILELRKIIDCESYFVPIALSLFTIGILEGFHSLLQDGNEFVWFHSLASLLGGIFLNAIWLNINFSKKHIFILYALIVFILISSIITLLFIPAPQMLQNGSFTITARLLNLGGGLLFLIASIKMLLNKNTHINQYLYVFIFTFLSIGISSILFEISELNDLTWWGWHFIRFFAYLYSLWFIAYVFKSLILSLKKSNEVIIRNNQMLVNRNKELINKNKELEQFVYIASHDLQEPLNSITSFSKLLILKNSENLDDVGKRSLNIIIESSDRMRSFIRGLLEYSRIGRKKELEIVSIEEIIQSIETDLTELIANNNAQIIYDELPTIMVYKTDLRLLFQNLISNSIKFKKDNEAPIIDISVKETKTHYEFCISDNGIGIDMEFKDKIFEIFQRLHTREKYEGSGIGLSHCKKIVSIHNGEIWIKPNLNGSTFMFTISKDLQ